MIKTHVKMMSLVATAAVVLGFSSCTKEETKPDVPQITPAIELVNKSDQNIMIPSGGLDPITIEYKSEAEVTDLAIEAVEGGDWCKAEFEGKSSIRITPSETKIGETSKAIFEVTNTVNEFTSPVEITIVRGYADLHPRSCIKLLDQKDANITMAQGTMDPILIGIEANFPVNELEIVSSNELITAEFEGEDQIKITPSKEGRREEQKAILTVRGNKAQTKAAMIFTPLEVNINVTRPAADIVERNVISFDTPEVRLDPAMLTEEIVTGTLNFPLSSLTIKAKDNAPDWCSVELTEEGIKVTKKINGEEEVRATFIIEGNAEVDEVSTIYTPKAVEITLIRSNEPLEPYVRLSGPGIEWHRNGYYYFDGDQKGGTLTVKVTTNQPKWLLNNVYQVEWLGISTLNGVNGDTITFTYPENPSGERVTTILYFEFSEYSFDGCMFQFNINEK